MSEAESWLGAQPKNEKGKVDVALVIAEGRRRGYCICPRPMRQLIDFKGLTCRWCGMPETEKSWAFWYAESPPARSN